MKRDLTEITLELEQITLSDHGRPLLDASPTAHHRSKMAKWLNDSIEQLQTLTITHKSQDTTTEYNNTEPFANNDFAFSFTSLPTVLFRRPEQSDPVWTMNPEQAQLVLYKPIIPILDNTIAERRRRRK